MITSILLNLIYGVIAIILSPLLLFSDVALPAQLTGALSYSSGYLSALNVIIPAYTITAVLLFISVLETIIFGYKITMWVIRKIPTIN